MTAKNLQKIYGMGEVKVEAVKNISLEIEKGYFYAIIGKSGSGKSTLLHLLSGFDKPTKGTVKIGGENIHKMKDKRLSAMRREKWALYSSRTICSRNFAWKKISGCLFT